MKKNYNGPDSGWGKYRICAYCDKETPAMSHGGYFFQMDGMGKAWHFHEDCWNQYGEMFISEWRILARNSKVETIWTSPLWRSRTT